MRRTHGADGSRRRPAAALLGLALLLAPVASGALASPVLGSVQSTDAQEQPRVVARPRLAAAGPDARSARAHAPQGRVLDLAASPGALRRVPDDYRPTFRWWWPRCGVSRDDLADGLDAMVRAGFRGAEQVLMGGYDPSGLTAQLGYLPTSPQSAVLDSCWHTQAFQQDLAAALEEADERGVTLDVTMGPGWPPSSPATTGDLAVQGLVVATVDVVGGVGYAGPLPRALPSVPAGLTTASAGVGLGGEDELVAVTAARVVDPSDTSAPVDLDRASAVDLTDAATAGSIVFRPEGLGTRWRIFALYRRPNGGGIPDPFSADATSAMLASFDETTFDALRLLLRRAGGDFFVDSPEWGVGTGAAIYWTHDLIEEFERRRGYDPTPFLPALFVPGQNGGVMGSATGPAEHDFGADGRRLRLDYYQTLTELYAERHIAPMQRWARGYGMHLAIQPAYGQTLGVVRSAVASDRPHHESLFAVDPGPGGFANPGAFGDLTPRPEGLGSDLARAAVDMYREVASGAHLSGRTAVVGNELACVFFADHQLTIRDLKTLADRGFAGGLNRVLLHGFDLPDGVPTTPWPGYHAFSGVFSEAYDPEHPMLRGLRGLADYWGRAAAALQNGLPTMDLAVYRHDYYTYVDRLEAPGDRGGAEPVGPLDGASLQQASYTWDLVDPATLVHDTELDGGVLNPHGGAYRALVLHLGARGAAARGLLPLDVAVRARRLAEGGLPVVLVGPLPGTGASFGRPRSEDRALAKEVRRLLALPTAARVAAEDALPAALRRLGVRPDVDVDGVANVLPVHRRTDSGDVWFLFNDSEETVQRWADFDATGRPVEVDLWDGTEKEVAVRREQAGRTRVRLDLEPGETVLLVFGGRPAGGLHASASDVQHLEVSGSVLLMEDGRSGTLRTTRLSDGRVDRWRVPRLPNPVEVSTWDLLVRDIGPTGTRTIRLPEMEPRDWRVTPELESVSGVGRYRAAVRIPRGWLESGRGVRLGLGAVGGAVEVLVNGQRVTRDPTDTWDRRVDAFLRPGVNELEVVVSTNRINKIVDLARSDPQPLYRLYTLRETQPAGLLKPVVLRPVAVRALR